MAATVAEAWQQVQQKILPPPLPPPHTPLTHSGLNTKVATKQQNPFNPVDENKNNTMAQKKNSLIRVITLIIKSTDSFSCIAKQCNPCNLVDNKKHRKNSAITSIELTKI